MLKKINFGISCREQSLKLFAKYFQSPMTTLKSNFVAEEMGKMFLPCGAVVLC